MDISAWSWGGLQIDKIMWDVTPWDQWNSAIENGHHNQSGLILVAWCRWMATVGSAHVPNQRLGMGRA